MPKMIQLLIPIAEAMEEPALCARLDGTAVYLNPAACRVWPVWEGMALPDFAPEFFSEGQFRPDFRYLDSHQCFYAGREMLEVERYADAFLCRLLPSSRVEKLVETGLEDEMEIARASARGSIREGALIEDNIIDDQLASSGLYLRVADGLDMSGRFCRRVALACNRTQLFLSGPGQFPAQTVDLTGALEQLAGEIRADLPGLPSPVEAILPGHPVAVRVNWTLLRQTVLEAARSAIGAAQRADGTMVFGIGLKQEDGEAVVTFSDNYSGLPGPDDGRPGPGVSYSSWNYIRRAAVLMGASLKQTETPYGDRALELRLPVLAEGLPRSSKVLLFGAGRAYRAADRISFTDPAIYLGKFCG